MYVKQDELRNTTVIHCVFCIIAVCTWAMWNRWSSCSRSCGIGSQSRYRYPTSGSQCPTNSTTETQPCTGTTCISPTSGMALLHAT